MKLTREITVTISSKEIVEFFVDVLYIKSKATVNMSTNTTMYRALSNLIGCSDVEAVRHANHWADDHDCPRIKVAEFRCWLTSTLSDVFAEYMGKTNEV